MSAPREKCGLYHWLDSVLNGLSGTRYLYLHCGVLFAILTVEQTGIGSVVSLHTATVNNFTCQHSHR